MDILISLSLLRHQRNTWQTYPKMTFNQSHTCITLSSWEPGQNMWFGFSMEFVDPVNFKFDPKKDYCGWAWLNQKKILKRTESFMMKNSSGLEEVSCHSSTVTNNKFCQQSNEFRSKFFPSQDCRWKLSSGSITALWVPRQRTQVSHTHTLYRNRWIMFILS